MESSSDSDLSDVPEAQFEGFVMVIPASSPPPAPATPAQPSSPQPSSPPRLVLRDDGTPKLQHSESPLFKSGVITRDLLGDQPHKVRYTCTQPNCTYTLVALITDSSTSNLWKHVNSKHPATSHELKAKKRHRSTSAAVVVQPASSFFDPRSAVKRPRLQSGSFRNLLLHFIVSNNLPISLVERQSFVDLIHNISPAMNIGSARTLRRELSQQFYYHRELLKHDLLNHTRTGGRLSLTTDAWSARNHKEFMAVTVHFITEDWTQRSTLLDVVHLVEPIHSGEYLARCLLGVTNYFEITGAVFTITRDNASPNTVMLQEFEAEAAQEEFTVEQPWTFRVDSGDVRCMAHVINLAVQAALKALRADPAEDENQYRLVDKCARLPPHPTSNIANVLEKLRRHIYVFNNRAGWRIGLEKQTVAAGLAIHALKLDMPVRWNSTRDMLQSALYLRGPITAFCASQQLDLSMRTIILDSEDWDVVVSLGELFEVFAGPTIKIQADAYPTLNLALPLYLRMIVKLFERRTRVGRDSTLGVACKVALDKLNEYYVLAVDQRASHSTIATICDPRFNLRVFDKLYPGSTAAQKRRRALDQFQACYRQYKSRADEIEADLPPPIATQEVDSDEDLYSSSNQPAGSEWERWLQEPGPGAKQDLMKYWSLKHHDYPIIAKMARDHLAIPATSAASERTFSNGGNIITKNRNRLSPDTTQYLLCLRSWGVLPAPEDDDDSLEGMLAAEERR